MSRKRALIRFDDEVEMYRKHAHACRMRFLYNMSWHEIAISRWPIDADGNPEPNAVQMFDDANVCRQSVIHYRNKNIVKFRDDVIADVRQHVAYRQQALASMVEAGDCDAIEQHREEDMLLLKMVGGYAPVKIAPTDVSGNDRPGILVIPATIDPGAWAASAVTYQENVRKLSIDHRRDED